MNEFFNDIFQIITNPPGNFTYHLVLAVSIAGALQTALNHWRENQSTPARRAFWGLMLLLLLQLGFFISSGLIWKGDLLPQQIMPSVDRAVALIGLVILIWLWAFPQRSRMADAAGVLLLLLAVTASVFAAISWQNVGSDTFYNGSWLDSAGSIVMLTLVALGALVLIIRRPAAWEYGLGMFLLLFAGHLTHWLSPYLQSDFAAAVRLAEMASFPLLLTLSQRYALLPGAAAPGVAPQEDKTRPTMNPRLAQMLLEASTAGETGAACREITRAVASMIVADICLLAAYEKNELVIVCGYDLIREEFTPPLTFEERQTPGICGALKRQRALRMPGTSAAADLLALAQGLKMERLGHLLLIPFLQSKPDSTAGLILLSPYSNRGWTAEEQNLLQNTADTLARILHHNQHFTRLVAEQNDLREAVQDAQTLSSQLQAENDQLRVRVDSLCLEATQAQTRAESLAAMLASFNSIQERVAILEEENTRLKAASAVSAPPATPDNRKQLEEELRLSLQEIARLKQVLSEIDREIITLQQQEPAPAAHTEEQVEVITSLAQDLRQPMSSIVGYTDLLLGESVGILGALQRKFLERIKASTERMGGLVDDLVQTITMNKDGKTLRPESVNLGEAIDEAIAITSAHLREKNIALRVNLPEQLPEIRADRDALQQIIIHLLQNAGAVTPPEGEIALHARIEDSDRAALYVLMQVTDSGGGIPSNDVPRVFSRLYRADNPLIQGVGDTGVGLSIAKSLVEAQGGRIWVDSDAGRGATFSVLLPLNQHPVVGHP